nr:hypothetical protein [Methanobrevibacter sp. AbM4]
MANVVFIAVPFSPNQYIAPPKFVAVLLANLVLIAVPFAPPQYIAPP